MDLSIWLMTCLLSAPHTIPLSLPSSRSLAPSLSLSLARSLALYLSPLPATNPTSPSSLPPLCHISLFPPFQSLGACVLAEAEQNSVPSRWALCALAQTQSMVREGKWRGTERKRETVGEKEGGKERRLQPGFASGRTLFQH